MQLKWAKGKGGNSAFGIEGFILIARLTEFVGLI